MGLHAAIQILFLFLALLSLFLTLWQWFAARHFPPRYSPPATRHSLGVTVLKPVKGLESDTLDCLKSWIHQTTPGPIQILFGVASPNDPIAQPLRQLIQEHPQADLQLIVCPVPLGPNAKVSTLAQLQPHAKHDIIIVSDADVRIDPGFIADAIAPLSDPSIGLVTCFYTLANPSTPAMHWEAVAINADFWSQVLQSQSLAPLDFALGAVMILRRSDLEQIGGFRSLLRHLADDYHLGHRIAKTGRSIHISDRTVQCWSAPMTWQAVWKHQLRWARTIRVSKPIPYLFSVLSISSVWPFFYFLATPEFTSTFLLTACWITRLVTATDHLQRFSYYSSLTLLFIIPKDFLQFAIWISSLLGNTIEWRSIRYRVTSSGELIPL